MLKRCCRRAVVVPKQRLGQRRAGIAFTLCHTRAASRGPFQQAGTRVASSYYSAAWAFNNAGSAAAARVPWHGPAGRRRVSSTPTPSPSDVEHWIRHKVQTGDFEGYLCSTLMPSSARLPALVMRALNVELASIKDTTRGNPTAGHMRMAFWRDFVAAAYEGGSNAHPLFAPFAFCVREHSITRRWLERIIEARELDLEGRPPASLAALEAYCDSTATSLIYTFLDALRVDDPRAEEAASHVGKAVGISILLRSLPVHSRTGQRYIPDDLMTQCGLSESDVAVRQSEVTDAHGNPVGEDGGSHADSRGAFGGGADSMVMARSGIAMFNSAQAGGASSQAGMGFNLPLRTDSEAPRSTPLQQSSTASARASNAGSGSRSVVPEPTLRMAGSRAAVSGMHAPTLRAPSVTHSGTTAAAISGASPIVTPGTASSNKPSYRVPSSASSSSSSASTGKPAEVPADALRVKKDAAAMARVCTAVKTLATVAQGHLDAARKLAPLVPHTAIPALLQAVCASRFLDQLRVAKYDPFAQGLGPWVDPRRTGRLRLQADLLKHTITSTY